MKNGEAFLAFTEESAQYLSGKKVVDYYQEALPSPVDEEIGKMVTRFMAATPQQRETFLTTLGQNNRSLFGIYGHRAATLSVRQESRQQLLLGLVGVAMANYTIPGKRRVDVGLAVYHHCARKLGVNTVDLFEDAATYATPDLAGRLVAFGRRGDVKLEKFGWRELRTDNGVKYKFTWG